MDDLDKRFVILEQLQRMEEQARGDKVMELKVDRRGRVIHAIHSIIDKLKSGDLKNLIDLVETAIKALDEIQNEFESTKSSEDGNHAPDN